LTSGFWVKAVARNSKLRIDQLRQFIDVGLLQKLAYLQNL
jgi:hypothetical protein